MAANRRKSGRRAGFFARAADPAARRPARRDFLREKAFCFFNFHRYFQAAAGNAATTHPSI